MWTCEKIKCPIILVFNIYHFIFRKHIMPNEKFPFIIFFHLFIFAQKAKTKQNPIVDEEHHNRTTLF